MRKQELIWLDTVENPEGQMELIIKYRGSTNEENAAVFWKSEIKIMSF